MWKRRGLGLYTIVYTVVISLIVVAFSAARGGTAEGWRLLVDNNPLEAQKAFEAQARSGDPQVRGSALRGLAAVSKFLGRDYEAMDYTFKSFLADRDTILFNTQWINVIPFGRTGGGHACRDGYRVMEMLTAEPSLYNGEHYSTYVDRLVNDGNLRKASKLMRRLGVVRSFMMIGPFENISGSGYRKQYPPETELDFTKRYRAKDGAQAGWHPFYNSSPNGWVFTERNYSQLHAVLYYYANIVSDADREACLGFGASGAFKVFFNDRLVLADSVFRNTGADMFMQKVRLKAGDNKLLIKLCHETAASNFLVRFMATDGAVLSGVRASNAAGSFTADSAVCADLRNSPVMERMTGYLKKMLAGDTGNMEAAILLMGLYNATEATDEGQAFARAMLERHAGSSLWQSLYSESLIRSRKLTDAQTRMKTAYKLCRHNKAAWESELDLLSSTAGSREVLEFLDNAPDIFRESAEALMARISHYLQTGNESQIMNTLAALERLYADNSTVAELLAAFYSNRGDIARARALLERRIRSQRSLIDAYEQLADLYLKMGNRAHAFRVFQTGLRYAPVSPGQYFYLARLLFQIKDYGRALRSIDAGLSFMPAESQFLNLKGAILAAQGAPAQAAQVLRRSIECDYNNFTAWDQLLPLEGKPAPGSLVPPADPDSVLAAARGWKDMDGDNGSILAYVNDVFFYPSRCSRERCFIMACVPTQSAIDAWKEYSIPYNGYYQTLNVTRAFSKGADGRETPADVSRNMAVFKTLRPGDFIVIEWTLDNYYSGDMAGHAWGEFSFDLPYPVHTSKLRLVMPAADTIGYRIQGDSVDASVVPAGDFRIVTFSRGPYRNPEAETFMLADPPSSNRVFYSTLSGWADIVRWYRTVTENKLEQTSELKAVADSILAGAGSIDEKVSRIHAFITGSIRYSFVPFRQSAWIPQPAREVLAARIGDCKDMASLAKSFFDYAGIQSNLVLVNTRDDNSLYPAYIGPNFNHCIVSYTHDGVTRYLDMTDNNLSAASLPKMDQGAVALMIAEGVDSLMHLPLDSCHQRLTRRMSVSRLAADGTLHATLTTTRTGIFAGQIRSLYRFLSPAERRRTLQKVLNEGFPGATVDTLSFAGLDAPVDTLEYSYGYSVKNAAHLSANTAILPLNLPDRITGENYPSEERRHYDIDMGHAWFDIGTFESEGVVEAPDGWRPITLPPPMVITAPYGRYELHFGRSGKKITYTRRATFDFREPIRAEENGRLRDFLSTIAKADNVYLMFYTE